MSKKPWILAALALVLVTVATGPLFAEGVTFKDPTGDDNGPGTYIYPTDAVYTRGSFDLTGLSVDVKGSRVNIGVSVAAGLDDPWRMGGGFAIQMAFVFIDNKEGGFTQGLPGLNIQFDEGSAWDKVVILSPQSFSRVKQEVEAKVPADMQSAVVIPSRTRGSGQTITATVKLEDLGEGDPATWGYQVVMQSNEGFPADTDLLTRKVNEFEGQHRFGGGTDYDCDPHVMDILAGKGEGAESEIQAQHDMLAYECNPDGTSKKMATLRMVRKAGG